MKKLLSIFLSAVMLLSVIGGMEFSVFALSESGACGENVSYSVKNGVVYISGTGNMYDYEETASPFYGSKDINEAVIENGVSNIGKNLFNSCSSLIKIFAAGSIASVEDSAFKACDNLKDVYFNSSESEWNGIAKNENNDVLNTAVMHYGCAFGKCGENIRYFVEKGVASLYGTGDMNNYSEGDSPFYADYAIKSVVIGEGITKTGDNSFSLCQNLTAVTLPSTVTSIGEASFSGCSALKNTALPDELKAIGNSAFADCTSIDYITVPETLETIGNGAFSGASLTEIFLPKSVKTIGGNAFSNCPLNKINLEKGARTVGAGAFSGCKDLENVYFSGSEANRSSLSVDGSDGGNDSFINAVWHYNCNIGKCGTNVIYSFDSSDGVLLVSGRGAMEDYLDSSPFSSKIAITKIVIEDGVTTVGEGAFSGCAGAGTVVIGNGITNIKARAFSGCTSIKELTMPCSAKIYNDETTFENCSNIRKLTITKGSGTMQNYSAVNLGPDKNTFFQFTPWYYSASVFKELVIEEGVKTIGDYAFLFSVGLSEVQIPASVTNIRDGAFSYCTGLVNVSVDDENANYCSEDGVLFNYNKTKLIVFPSGSGKTSYEIPQTVETIVESAFTSCKTLIEITIPQSVTSIGAQAFSNCTALSEVVLPDHLQTIPERAFSGCTRLKKAVFGSRVRTVGTDAFSGCTSLTEVKMSDVLKTIGSDAFYGCSMLRTVTIPDYVTKIGTRAFSGCQSIMSISIPDTLINLEGYVFADCSALSKVTIGTELETIDPYAFYNCDNIDTVYLFSEEIDSTEDLVAQMPVGSTLYAYDTTDARDECFAFAINFIPYEPYDCENGIHNYYALITKYPDCEEEGVTTYKCHYCESEYTESIAAYGHKAITDKAVEPTCTETGLTKGTHCFVCGKVITPQEVIPANGHSYEITGGEATCTKGGTAVYTCTVCGDSYEEISEALGHDFGDNEKQCRRCGVENPDYVEPETPTQPEDEDTTSEGEEGKSDDKNNGDDSSTEPSGKSGNSASQPADNSNAEIAKFKLSAPVITKLKKGKKRFTVKWKKVKGADGYQIQFSRSKRMKKAKKKTVKAKRKKLTVKKLKSKKKYFVRIRAFKKINGKRVYSKWSKVKRVKTK